MSHVARRIRPEGEARRPAPPTATAPFPHPDPSLRRPPYRRRVRRTMPPALRCRRRSLEPMTGLEPVTSSLPRTRSTTELHRLVPAFSGTGAPAGDRFARRRHPGRPRGYWSGRRGSNPRPTAWKAVTLPLSYSRFPSGSARPLHALSPVPGAGPPPLAYRRPSFTSSSDPARPRERRVVARGGFEPPKPLGRQIYSLLRLTAPQPRRSLVRHVGRHPRRPALRQKRSLGFLGLGNRASRAHPLRRPPPRSSVRTLRLAVELAKGFEPPTG